MWGVFKPQMVAYPLCVHQPQRIEVNKTVKSHSRSLPIYEFGTLYKQVPPVREVYSSCLSALNLHCLCAIMPTEFVLYVSDDHQKQLLSNCSE